MEGVVIIYTTHFMRAYRALPEPVRWQAKQQEKLFRQNPFHPVLKTHKLEGKFKGLFSFSINYHYRIICEFGEKRRIYFHDIGDHDVYK